MLSLAVVLFNLFNVLNSFLKNFHLSFFFKLLLMIDYSILLYCIYNNVIELTCISTAGPKYLSPFHQ